MCQGEAERVVCVRGEECAASGERSVLCQEEEEWSVCVKRMVSVLCVSQQRPPPLHTYLSQHVVTVTVS